MPERPEATWRIETYSRRGLRGRRWYFRARGANGEPIFPSEAYTTAKARDDTVALVVEPSGAEVIELP
jgi:uncharacterized protein YegP (UPF0339 family)